MNRMVALRNEISDYLDTVCAILGFVNFYRFDDTTQKMRDEVIIFQGRRLNPSPVKSRTAEGNAIPFVTPDFGVLYAPDRGLLGEAKKSFPRDRSLWKDDFRQLMAYDDDLSGWPCPKQQVGTHDIVLLTDQSRVVAVYEYCQELMAAGKVSFTRPFAVVSFNRRDEGDSYFHFERRFGALSQEDLDTRLHYGISVPMRVFVEIYSTIKLYDAEPPLPYMMSLIWEHVAAPRAAEDPRFPGLRRRQKLEVSLTIDEIVNELSEGFSFRLLCPHLVDRQPLVPPREWCVRACDALVKGDLAKWSQPQRKDSLRILFRRLDDVLGEMVAICAREAEEHAHQLPLFADESQVGIVEYDATKR